MYDTSFPRIERRSFKHKGNFGVKFTVTTVAELIKKLEILMIVNLFYSIRKIKVVIFVVLK